LARSEEDCLAHMLSAARRAIVWQIVKNDLPPVVDALRTMVPLEGAPDA